MKVQKIHHVAVECAVNHVANRTAQYAGKCKGKQLLTRVRFEHPDDKNRCSNTDASKKPALPATCIGQKRESSTGVVHANNIKKTGDVSRVAQTVIAQDQHLGELVCNQYQQRQAQPRQHATRRFGKVCFCHYANVLVSPAPYKLLIQRPQIVGCSA